MKTVILGDVHFGSSYSMGYSDSYRRLNTRLIDFSNTFDYVVDYMANNAIKHFVICGDIFEYKRPQASELSLFSEKIRRLEELGINTHIVIGNHDLISEQRVTTVDVLQKLKLPKTFIHADIETATCENKLNIAFMPFRKRSMLDCQTNEEAVKKLSDRLQFEIGSIENVAPKIVVGHLLLQDSRIGNTILDGSDAEIALPIEMFNNFDAVIMGHVHPHQIICQDPLVTYIGSMERKDFGEEGVNKYFLVVEVNGNDLSFVFEPLPARKVFDIVVDQSHAKNGLEATKGVKEFLSQYSARKDLSESIIRVTVFANEKSLFDLNKEEIRIFTKRTLKVNYCMNIHTQIVSERQLRKSSITEKNDPKSAYVEFLSLVEDEELRGKMFEIGMKIIEERGKKNDSD